MNTTIQSILEPTSELLSDEFYHEYLKTLNEIQLSQEYILELNILSDTPNDLIVLNKYKINLLYDLMDYIELLAIDKINCLV